MLPECPKCGWSDVLYDEKIYRCPVCGSRKLWFTHLRYPLMGNNRRVLIDLKNPDVVLDTEESSMTIIHTIQWHKLEGDKDEK